MHWKFFLFFCFVSCAQINGQFDIGLYKGEDHADLLEEVYIGYLGACRNLTVGRNSVGSVDTKGSCIQLYDQENCRGNHIKIASTTFAYNNLKQFKFENRAMSAGTCTTTIHLFNQPQYRGQMKKIKLWGTADCVNLAETHKPVSSINTQGGCVILHRDPNCMGHSIKFKGHQNVNEQEFVDTHFGSVSSLSACPATDQYRTNPFLPSPTPSSGPIFGQYLRETNSVVIKSPQVPYDHFCELSRRCTKNRKFNCQKKFRSSLFCYCDVKKSTVTCDMGVTGGSSEDFSSSFIKDETNREPIVGQYGGSEIENGGWVSLLSPAYETPYVNVYELAKRCENQNEISWYRPNKQYIGGDGESIYCHVDLNKSSSKSSFGTGAPVIPRSSKPLDEDEDFESISN